MNGFYADRIHSHFGFSILDFGLAQEAIAYFNAAGRATAKRVLRFALSVVSCRLSVLHLVAATCYLRALCRGTQALALSICLAVLLSGCARLLQRPTPTATISDQPDPYTKALQEAMVRQHISQIRGKSSGYRIGPNDVIEIRIFRYDKMNSLARVGEDGMVNLPPLGPIQVAGLTEREVEDLLREQLRGKYLQDPHIIVFVREPRAMEVAIVGEVTKPGTYSMMGTKNLLDLLAQAGGMKESAGNVAYLVRLENQSDTSASATLPAPVGLLNNPTSNPANLVPGAKSIKIDLDGLLIRGEEQWNIPLRSGDIVTVPEAGWVHVTGHGIEKPGTYPLTRRSKTLRQIIDEAGGLKFEASNTILVIHKTESGSEEITKVKYSDATKDTRNDTSLRAGDRIVTDRTIIKRTMAVVAKTVTTLVHIGLYGSIPLFPAG